MNRLASRFSRGHRSLDRGLRASGIVGFALFLSSPATAERIPLGGRTATMGGAAVAAGSDSAMPYLNPAGLASVPGGVFGISATLYSYRVLTISDYFLPSGWNSEDELTYGRLKVQRDSMASSTYVEMPSSLMYFGPMGDLGRHGNYKLGLALVTPEVERRELVGTFSGNLPDVNGSYERSTGLSYRRTDYYAGPSLALGFSLRPEATPGVPPPRKARHDLRLGVSAFAYYSRYHRVETASARLSALGGTARASAEWTAASGGESLGVVPVLGAQLRLVSELWAGAAVAAPSVHLWGWRNANGTVASESTNADGTLAATEYDTVAAGDYRQGAPWRLTGGLAWDDRQHFSVAADITYRAPLQDALHYPVISRESYTGTGEISRRYTRTQDPVSVDLNATFDLSLGVEVVLGPMFSLRAGGFSDFSNAEPLRTDVNEQPNRTRLDQFGGSLGLGMNQSVFDTTLGLVYARGQGEISALDFSDQSAFTPRPVDAVQHAFFLVLSGTITDEDRRQRIAGTGGLRQLPRLPGAPTRGLTYEPPPRAPQGLPGTGPAPMTRAEVDAVLGATVAGAATAEAPAPANQPPGTPVGGPPVGAPPASSSVPPAGPAMSPGPLPLPEATP